MNNQSMAKRSKKKSGGSSIKTVAGVGVGLALVAAAAAGTYFLYGTKEGTKKRKKIKGWMLKAKGEILEQIENLKDLNEKVYREIVDTVADRYRKLKNVDTKELDSMVKELKSHWKHIQKHIGGTKSKTKRRTAKRASTKQSSKVKPTRKRKK